MQFRFTNHAKSRLGLHFKGLTEKGASKVIHDNIMKLKLDTVRDMYTLTTDIAVFILSKKLWVVTMYKKKDWYTKLLLENLSEKKIKEILFYKEENDIKG